ncbi:thioredoxin domain-containing protein [Vulgatibacter sp.]|uniref:thioredoxin domain-containing protein n=1 Tax=Vulgatibacter sp. TaxID=1971226 RepID=UPI00356B0FE3
MAEGNRPTNRLANEASPYLRQHMHNPVDWYPWGDEALEKARREEKPILLSVGYAACHWCHVMEKDAFEVEAVAAEMNRHFVSIKVDREERPDIDALYQGVVQLMGRGGGWPLTVFLTPEGRPFFGGTYFPPEDRYGLPGFSRLLGALAEAWRTRRAEVEQSAASFAEGLGKIAAVGIGASEGEIGAADLVEAGARLVQELDQANGGFFGAPKFPHPLELAFLLRLAGRGIEGLGATDRATTERALRLSLDHMAQRGLYDQLGGGFHRYSVDEAWAVPHFEKMLYDNALLVRLYAEAAVAFGSGAYERVAHETAGWLAREMTDPGGGLYASQDADSEGVEGKFFVWTPAEIRAALGDDLGELAAAHFGVTPAGNFDHGTTVLHVAKPADALASERGLPVEDVRARLAAAKEQLLEVRMARIRPGTDDKVLAGWNGLAIGGLAAAGRLLGAPAMIEQARRAASFVLGTLVVEGRLQRVYRLGQVKQPAFLDDHAWLCEGLVELFESTGEGQWLDAARGLAGEMIDRYWDEARGIFFLDPADGPGLLHRVPAVHDNATPSGGSSAIHAFLRIHALTGDERVGAVASRYLRLQRDEMGRNPFAFGHLLAAAWLQVRGIVEVAVLGPAGPEREGLLAAARRGYRPEILAFAAEQGVGEMVAGRGALGGKAAAYVCRNFACERARTGADELAQALEEA